MTRRLLLPVCLAVACQPPADAPPGPAGVCNPVVAARDCTPHEVLVVTSDLSSSAVGAFDLDGKGYVLPGADLGKDPILARSAGRSFLVARDADALFELDGLCGLPRAKIPVSDPTRPGTSNPQDVAVGPDGALWVPRFNTPRLSVLEPCGERRWEVDLSSFDDDGNPNASAVHMETVGGVAKAFVALERLDDRDRLVSRRPSWLLRIDAATGTVEGHVELKARNPFGQMVAHGGALYLAAPGNFDAAAEEGAGIERFDPQEGTSRLLVKESELGASVTIVAITEGCGAALVADPVPNENHTALITFDPATGRVLRSFATPVYGPTPGYDLFALAWHRGVLLVGDRRRAPAGYPVHAFERVPGQACELRPREDQVFLPLPPLALGGEASEMTSP